MNWQTLIEKGESETLEFKRNTGMLKEAIQTLCAMANRSGGTVIFGVKDDGTMEGQQISDDTLLAIRESVVNMLVHRDYRVGIRNTVEIRPDFLLFQNPAHLFGPAITIEKLYGPHVSRPGNKKIAHAFYLSGLFENWGSGALSIVQQLESAGLGKPVFAFDDGVFRLRIPRRKVEKMPENA